MSPAPTRELGDFIKRQRQAAGLSGYKLAQEAGIPRSQVLRIERGDIQPGPDTLSRLADALRVEVEDLYALAGYTKPEGLPGFETYLRTKYGMSGTALEEAMQIFADLQAEEGVDVERGR